MIWCVSVQYFCGCSILQLAALTQCCPDQTCCLTADARVLKHKHKFETDSDSCSTMHWSYTAYKWYSASCWCWCVYHGRTATATAAISWRHHAKEMLPTRFPRNCPIRTAFTFHCRHDGLFCHKLNLEIINECKYALKMGSEGFFIITCEIIVSWRSVSSFWGCPKGLEHNLEFWSTFIQFHCATGHEFQALFFAFWNMLK